jgi:hypothetical protein
MLFGYGALWSRLVTMRQLRHSGADNKSHTRGADESSRSPNARGAARLPAAQLPCYAGDSALRAHAAPTPYTALPMRSRNLAPLVIALLPDCSRGRTGLP